MSSLLGFCLGWCSNFVGSESVQKQSVKLLQNMVYLNPTATHCLYLLYVYIGKSGGRGGGGQREGRGATVHMRGRKYQHDWLYLQSINSIKHQYRRHLGFCVIIVPSSMRQTIESISFMTAMACICCVSNMPETMLSLEGRRTRPGVRGGWPYGARRPSLNIPGLDCTTSRMLQHGVNK
jgi:hypothetical protein